MPYHFVAARTQKLAEEYANHVYRVPGGYGVKLKREDVVRKLKRIKTPLPVPIWQVLTIPCSARDLSFAKLSTDKDPTPWAHVVAFTGSGTV